MIHLRKRRSFAWLTLLVLPLLMLVAGNFIFGAEKEVAEAHVDATPIDLEVPEEDPYEAYSDFIVDIQESFYTPSMKEKTLSRGVHAPYEGESLLLQLKQKESAILVQQKWDVSFASLELMAPLLDFEFTWIVPQKEVLLVKTTEKGRIHTSISVNSRKALVEFQDERLYQSEIQLLGETYLNEHQQLMMPMEDLLGMNGYDIAFSGGDLVEISSPKNGDPKMHILSYLDVNNEKAEEGYYEELEKSQTDQEVRFILLGDMGLGTSYGRKNPFDEKWVEYGGGHFLSHLKKDFDAADLVITNLENVFTERKATQPEKIYTYKAHRIDYLDVLTEGGITHVNVVNNHMVDYLQEGFDDTLSYLDEYGIEYFGTNLTKTDNIELGNIEVESHSVFEKDGFKVGMLGYLGFNTSFVSDEKILEDIRMMKEVEKVDYIIAAMHWGGQNTHEVGWRQKEMGRMLIDSGVDLVYGNHPHVLQELEIYNGKPIYYSLGNFLFIDYKSAKDPDGAMVTVDLKKDGFGEISASLSHTPILWSGDPVKNTYMPLRTEDPFLIRRTLDKLNVETTAPIHLN